MTQKPIHIPILYGPTATGKTSRAIEMARAKNGVIINADAMQCYKPLPVLTAQPSEAERAAAPHRLYGVVPADEDCTVTRWQAMAVDEINKAVSGGHTPIIVGGTGFYIKALTEGLSPIPDIPASIRAEGEKRLEQEGIDALYQELKAVNAEHVRRFDRYNPRRVLRAWEVWKATGKTLQTWQDMPRVPPPAHFRFDLTPVIRPRGELIERINYRFDNMLDAGALEEVEQLSARIDAGEVPADALVTKAHGFRPLRAYLKNEMALDDAITRSKIETRQYAKRQMTWLRGQFRIQ